MKVELYDVYLPDEDLFLAKYLAADLHQPEAHV